MICFGMCWFGLDRLGWVKFRLGRGGLGWFGLGLRGLGCVWLDYFRWVGLGWVVLG